MAIIPELPQVRLSGPLGESPDISAATAVGRAYSSFGESVTKVGDDIQRMMDKRQRAIDVGAKASLRLAIQKAEADHQNFRAKNPDESTWEADFQERMSRIRGNLPSDVSREGAFELEYELERDTALGSRKVTGDALNQANKRSLMASETLIGGYVDALDYDSAAAVIDDNVRAGLLLPEEGEAKKHSLKQQIGGQIMKDLSVMDPKEALRLAKNPEEFSSVVPGASEADRRRFEYNAQLGFQRKQREQMQDVVGRIRTGQIQTEDELDRELKAQDYIEEGLHDEMKFHFQQSQPVDRETRFGLSDSLNEIYEAYKRGEMNQDEYREAHDSIGQVIFTLGNRDGAGALESQWNRLDPVNWDGRNLNEAKRESMDRKVEERGKFYLDSKAFGSISDEEAKTLEPGEIIKRTDEMRAKRDRFQTDLRERIAGFDPNDPEIDEKIRQEARKAYMDQVTSDILRPKTGNMTLPEVEDYINQNTGGADPKGASSRISTEPAGGNVTELVKHFEAGGEKQGFHPTAYWDYGQWSIGYGTKSRQGETITKAEAAKRLETELSSHQKRVVAAVNKYGLKLQPHQIDALTSFDYNTGKIEQLLAGGSRAPAEIASKMLLYNKAGGKRLPGLDRRRIAEATLFRKGYKAEKKEVAKDVTPRDPALNTGEHAEYNVIQDG